MSCRAPAKKVGMKVQYLISPRVQLLPQPRQQASGAITHTPRQRQRLSRLDLVIGHLGPEELFCSKQRAAVFLIEADPPTREKPEHHIAPLHGLPDWRRRVGERPRRVDC